MTFREHWLEEVRNQIRDAGQELIDRANEFVPNSALLTSEVNINIKIDSLSKIPLITISRITPCDTTRVRLQSKQKV